MQSILSKPFCSAAHWPFFSAVSVFSPKEKGSFYENRRLAVFPVPSVETVLDGTFFSNVETYISDHFAYRVPLLRLNVRKGACAAQSGRQQHGYRRRYAAALSRQAAHRL